MRFVAAVSRLSLRDPFAPETDLTRRRRSKDGDGRSDADATASTDVIHIADETPEPELVDA
jgi:hypothetical protein